MSKAAHANTALPGAAGTPITGALILALAALHRELEAANDALMRGIPKANRVCVERSRDRWENVTVSRMCAISYAISAIRADSLAGAMVQTETLAAKLDADPVEDAWLARFEAELAGCAVSSIHNVMSRITGRTTADGPGWLPCERDMSRLDIEALPGDWATWQARRDAALVGGGAA